MPFLVTLPKGFQHWDTGTRWENVFNPIKPVLYENLLNPWGGHMARGYFLANKRSLNDALWNLRSPNQYLSKNAQLAPSVT